MESLGIIFIIILLIGMLLYQIYDKVLKKLFEIARGFQFKINHLVNQIKLNRLKRQNINFILKNIQKTNINVQDIKRFKKDLLNMLTISTVDTQEVNRLLRIYINHSEIHKWDLNKTKIIVKYCKLSSEMNKRPDYYVDEVLTIAKKIDIRQDQELEELFELSHKFYLKIIKNNIPFYDINIKEVSNYSRNKVEFYCFISLIQDVINNRIIKPNDIIYNIIPLINKLYDNFDDVINICEIISKYLRNFSDLNLNSAIFLQNTLPSILISLKDLQEINTLFKNKETLYKVTFNDKNFPLIIFILPYLENENLDTILTHINKSATILPYLYPTLSRINDDIIILNKALKNNKRGDSFIEYIHHLINKMLILEEDKTEYELTIEHIFEDGYQDDYYEGIGKHKIVGIPIIN